MSAERPTYEVYVPERADVNVPRNERNVDYVDSPLPNPFLIDALMWEARRRERQLENEGGE